jgi:RHS repeat-associated protein
VNETILSHFAGEYRDLVSAGYPLGQGYRWYLPGLMRFNQPDSFSPFGPAGINAYAYCDADPVNRADPSGHLSIFRRLFNAIRKRVRPGEEIAESVPQTRSPFPLQLDVPIGARNVIQRTTSLPSDLSRFDMETHVSAVEPLPHREQAGTHQEPGFPGLRKLPDMSHLPHLWETQANDQFAHGLQFVDSLEAEWGNMKELNTRKSRSLWDIEAPRFVRWENVRNETRMGLEKWKNDHIPASFGLPSMKASGDTHYGFIGKYLAASSRLNRLYEETESARGFFLIPPEHQEE